jgi:hypothetical protein
MALGTVLRLGVVVGGCVAMRGRWATALLISDAFFQTLDRYTLPMYVPRHLPTSFRFIAFHLASS